MEREISYNLKAMRLKEEHTRLSLEDRQRNRSVVDRKDAQKSTT